MGRNRILVPRFTITVRSSTEKADASRLAALHVGHISRYYSLLAPCQPGASAFSVRDRNYEPWHTGRALDLELQIFLQSLRVGTGHRDLGFVGVGHLEEDRPIEPRYDFFDALQVDDEGTVHTPENGGVQARHQLVKCPQVGSSGVFVRRDGDDAVFDRSVDDILRVDEHIVLGRLSPRHV